MTDAERITSDRPPMKVTVYLKSGNVVTFPGRVFKEHGRTGIATLADQSMEYLDWDSVEMITQQPWTEER